MSDRIILKGNSNLLKPVIMQVLALHQLLEHKDVGNIYGMPVTEYDRSFKYKPQVHLHFYQFRVNIPNPNNGGISSKPVESVISFRLMNETSESLTTTKLQTLANQIKAHFGLDNGYSWQKGRTRVNYYEREKGYKLTLLCRTKADGKSLIQKILSIQGHTPDWTKMTTTENEEPLQAFPDIPSPRTQRILETIVETPQERPVVNVKYRYSTISIHGLGQPRGLHDLTNKIKYPLAK